MGVGLRLKIALREKKMTIKEFSAQSNISLNTLYSITKRDTENVDDVILSMISKTTGLSWAFFCSCSPFEDLDFLQRNKETILLELEKAGSFSINERPAADISNYEFWKIISNNLSDITTDENGHLQFLPYESVLLGVKYNPNTDMGADVDILLETFIKLEPSGRKLVVEYAELLARNPGFLLKDNNDNIKWDCRRIDK